MYAVFISCDFMTSQQLDNRSQHLEARIEKLEVELSKLQQRLPDPIQKERPWWNTVAGSFRTDPTFDEATYAGQEWRQSAE